MGPARAQCSRRCSGSSKPLGGQVSRQISLSISYVPQRDRIDAGIPITVLEVVLMGLAARSGAFHRAGADDREAARRALGLLGDEGLGPLLFRNLSRGQQQRVPLARALAGEPDRPVLDEPTAGTDLASEAVMIEFLRELNHRRRVTIVVVTHLLPIVLNLATSIMLVGGHTILQVRSTTFFEKIAWRLARRSGASRHRRGTTHSGCGRRPPCLNRRSCRWRCLRRWPRGSRSASWVSTLPYGAWCSLVSSLPTPRRSERQWPIPSGGRRSGCQSPQVSLPPQFLARSGRRRGVSDESMMGWAYAAAASATVLILSQAAGGSVDTLHLLFGNVLAIQTSHVIALLIQAAVVLSLHVLFWRRFLLVTFDAEAAKVAGVRTRWWSLTINLLIGGVGAGAVHEIGALSTFALLTLPAMAALLVTGSIRATFVVATGLGMLVPSLALAASFYFDLPAGPACAAFLALSVALAAVGSKYREVGRPISRQVSEPGRHRRAPLLDGP